MGGFRHRSRPLSRRSTVDARPWAQPTQSPIFAFVVPPSAEVVPRPAATVLALRRSGSPFEVLMVRRAREASFMGGARVFPGGAVDAADSGPLAASVVRWSGDNEERPWRAAAMRELAEEVGIFIGAPTTHMAGDREGTSIAPWRMPRSSLTARVWCTSATGSPPAAPQAVRHPLLHRRSTSGYGGTVRSHRGVRSDLGDPRRCACRGR